MRIETNNGTTTEEEVKSLPLNKPREGLVCLIYDQNKKFNYRMQMIIANAKSSSQQYYEVFTLAGHPNVFQICAKNKNLDEQLKTWGKTDKLATVSFG